MTTNYKERSINSVPKKQPAEQFCLAGCVILYKPDREVIDNIKTYIEHLCVLYIVDNENGKVIFDELSGIYNNIELVTYSENMGIAKPLNDVLKRINGKYTHLMTMDQDSKFDTEDIKMYIKFAREVNWDNVLSIAPKPISKDQNKIVVSNAPLWEERLYVITSGNIVNVANAIKIGGYDEKLFIDEVDHDFCYRGWKHHLRTLRSNGVIFLRHTIGCPTESRFLGIKIRPMHHNYIRKYYIARNSIYVGCKNISYKKIFIVKYCMYILKIAIHTLLCERDKLRKIKYMIIGVRDAIYGNMGKKDFNNSNKHIRSVG